MVTDRLLYLERKVSDMESEQSAHATELEAISKQLDALTPAVRDLTAALNRGKGAVWGIVAMSSAASAIVTWAGMHFGSKP